MPGKHMEAIPWPGGDAANMLNGLDAFAEVPGPTNPLER